MAKDIYGAAQKGDLDALLRFATATPEAIDKPNADGRTALMLAAEFRKQAAVEQLIKLKANLDLTSKDGKTALLIAANLGVMDVCRVLIEAGADKTKTFQGKTAVELLIAKKPALAETIKGWTAKPAEVAAAEAKDGASGMPALSVSVSVAEAGEAGAGAMGAMGEVKSTPTPASAPTPASVAASFTSPSRPGAVLPAAPGGLGGPQDAKAAAAQKVCFYSVFCCFLLFWCSALVVVVFVVFRGL